MCGLNAAFPSPDFENWASCERLAQQGLAASELIATYGLQSNVSARLLNQVAFYLQARGQYAVAEPLYQQALEIDRQVLGEQHPDFASSLNNLAALYYSTGRYEQAEPLYQQALEIRRQVLGEQHPDFAISLNNLAALYDSTGRYEQAEPLYQQALEIRRQVLGEQHPDFATQPQQPGGAVPRDGPL